MNDYIAWNLKAKDDSNINKMSHAHLVAVYFNELLDFKDIHEQAQSAYVNIYKENQFGNEYNTHVNSNMYEIKVLVDRDEIPDKITLKDTVANKSCISFSSSKMNPNVRNKNKKSARLAIVTPLQL